MFCGFKNNSEENVPFYDYLRETASDVLNWLDEKFSFLEPAPLTWEYRGIVHSSEPIDPPSSRPTLQPSTQPTLTQPTLTQPTLTQPTLTQPTLTQPTLTQPAPSCHHLLKFMDGEEFELHFPDVPFSSITPMLQRGRAVQIIYSLQGVEEIHPLKLDFHVKTVRQLLDEVDLDYDQTLMKVRYEPGSRQPTTLEMIPDPIFSDNETKED